MPINDNNNSSSVGIVTHSLIAINIAVFVFISLPLMHTQATSNLPFWSHFVNSIESGGNALPALSEISAYAVYCFHYGFQPGDPKITTLFGSIFLHSNIWHLASNVLFLWVFGNNIEQYLGRFWFVTVYIIGGVFASLFFMQFVPGSMKPFIGASGAISCLLGCYYLLFGGNTVKVYFFVFPFIVNFFILPCRMFMGFYLLADNIYPFIVSGSADTEMAHASHIGGFLFGLIIIAVHLKWKNYCGQNRQYRSI